jgi:dihydrolipoamide dehydrogenase
MSEQPFPSKAQLVVVGAGPAGYTAAFRAADLGLDVTVVDPEPDPGGVCLYRGCIPSKALLHVARVIEEARESAALGVTFVEPSIDLDRVRAWKDEVVSKLTSGLGQRTKTKKLTYIPGKAELKGGHTLRVTSNDGAKGEIAFEQAIVATGSRPAMLPGVVTSDRILDSTTALELHEIPRSLLVVGGGYIGLELGTVYATLGSRVSVVEMTSGLLPGCDRDLVSVLKRRLDARLEAVMLDTRVLNIQEQAGEVTVKLENKEGKPI